MQNQKGKTDKSWAAGFFDGEGCIRVNKPTNPQADQWRKGVKPNEAKKSYGNSGNAVG